jgi:hypothetical protein
LVEGVEAFSFEALIRIRGGEGFVEIGFRKANRLGEKSTKCEIGSDGGCEGAACSV